MSSEIKPPAGPDIKALKKRAILLVIIIFSILGLGFFLPAGTIFYWEGWAYIITLLIPMSIFGLTLFKHDPKLLERRLRTGEKRKKQKFIVKFGTIPLLSAFFLPGFDRRFGWSNLPLAAEIAGLVLVLTGYVMTLYVFRTNRYASRVVDVEKEQKVITTGPYSVVRHPMYGALLLFYGGTPLALGSLWALIPAALIIPVLVMRILDEEKELIQNLSGYREYTEKTKYRLIPGIW